jgi:hypothetical protein
MEKHGHLQDLAALFLEKKPLPPATHGTGVLVSPTAGLDTSVNTEICRKYFDMDMS